jgi:hypothetical protein
MQNDNFNQIPGNVSSIIDLLEDKGISWSQYQEYVRRTDSIGQPISDGFSTAFRTIRAQETC